MKDVFAYMIGPKAENLELFKKLITEALDDHLYWRRNFYPEDLPAASAVDQGSEEYQRFVEKLRDGLFEFLSEAKKGIPFFSSRYIGHMNTDLLMPGLVGYFAAMLYNQNNVAGESSPVTSRLEAEVIEMMAKMVGFRGNRAFGYLSSGGTTANFYGLWVARNLRMLPVSLRLAVEHGIDHAMTEAFSDALISKSYQELAGSAKEILKATVGSLRGLVLPIVGQARDEELVGLTARQLLNLPIDEVSRVRSLAVDRVCGLVELPPAVARMAFDQLVGLHSIQNLGDYEFRKRAASLFVGRDAEVFRKPWRVVVPKNGHYSWLKATDLLGLGQASLVKIDPGFAFDMDLVKLEAALRDVAERGELALALASIFGTTEEGSVDDLPGVRDILTGLQKELGFTVWWHVDAAYGGYLPSMMRARLDDERYVDVGSVHVDGTLKHWLHDCCLSVDLDSDTAVQLIEMSESGKGTWMSWEQLMRRTAGLEFADSITLDPHKLGYVPYPAGAVLLREGAGRHQVGSDAPYLWADSLEPAEFVGRFTLEGSRPGAAAAGCWLAHRMVPLDQSGHGRIIALSILGTRRLYAALQERFKDKTDGSRLGVVHQPHTNMLCYVPYHTDASTPAMVARLTKAVQQQLIPTNEIRPFMAVDTTVRLTAGNPSMSEFDGSESLSRILREEPEIDLPVIRSVVMGPYSVAAKIRQSTRGKARPVFEAFSEHLDNQIESSSAQIQRALFREAAAKWSRPLNSMLMDDDETVSEQLRNLIPELRDGAISHTWQALTRQDEALRNIDDASRPLDLVFLDIDMRGASADPRGSDVGGYVAFRSILKRNSRSGSADLSVKLVVFFTMSESVIHHERLEAIRAEFPGVDVQTETLDKKLFPLNAAIQYDGGPDLDNSRSELVRTVRRLVRRIAAISLPVL